MHLFPTLRNYKKENLGKDILAGLIIMAVSIPISMGYAQIAGDVYKRQVLRRVKQEKERWSF